MPVVAVPESMRRILDGRIVGVLDRTDLFRSQTPHGVQRQLLLQAYAKTDPRNTETFIDETISCTCGAEVAPVMGEPQNFKLTFPGDLEMALSL